MKQTLIVVYKEKDEVAVNLLRKLLEKKDDVEGEVVGVEDRSVELVTWTEKVWLDNKAKGTTKSKILFLSDVKGADKLVPVIDEKYNKYGVRYGWAGSQALIELHIDVEKFTSDNYCHKSYSWEQCLEQFVEKQFGAAKLFIPKNKRRWMAAKDTRFVRLVMMQYAVATMYENDLEAFLKE